MRASSSMSASAPASAASTLSGRKPRATSPSRAPPRGPVATMPFTSAPPATPTLSRSSRMTLSAVFFPTPAALEMYATSPPPIARATACGVPRPQMARALRGPTPFTANSDSKMSRSDSSENP